MKQSSFKLFLAGAMALGLALPAMAVNSHYAAGDLVLFFQKFDGLAVTTTVYVGLGPATNFRGTAIGPADVSNNLNFLDINSSLKATFGDNWATDPGIYVGLAGNFNNTNNTVVVNGDISRTLYVSSPRYSVDSVGSPNSTVWEFYDSTPFTSAAAQIQQQNNIFADTGNLYGYNAQYIESPPAVSKIDDNNPISKVGEIVLQETAFKEFDGGVQQAGSASSLGAFGPVTSTEFALDLYRIVPTNTTNPLQIHGIIDGSTRTGSYEGTITIDTDGKVSFITHGTTPASAYDDWMAQFTSITAPADKLPGADPDKDGADNLEEFGFGGDPSKGTDQGARLIQTVDTNGDSKPDLTLTLEVRSGATFPASGAPLASGAIDEVVYQIQGSQDLATWTSTVRVVDPPLGSGPLSSGYVFKTFSLDNGGTGLTGKGFLRASVTK